ncbi:hypothetical protein M378DRAFT_186830 [Amanita muscaria Koide BX008]|uniref:DUF6533 domain-containing protein n=1 Tax=Amanita muscaria (strain Koide BX008) TaxID=946122 RepID=A0A0C2SLQ0_AMAMK|nr:hypothetical protein M378DRAFT_186830 [Amanita muscaria Koide BX008]
MTDILNFSVLAQHRSYVLLHDYFLTIHLEINYVWKSKWSFVKFLYLIIRYIPFITLIFVFALNIPGLETQNCMSITRAYVVMLTFGSGICEIILTLRTWAICGRGFKMGIMFLLFFLFKTMIAYILEGLWWSQLQYILWPTGQGDSTGLCLVVNSSKIVWGSWITVVVFETVVVFLLALQASSAYKSGGVSELALVVYRDAGNVPFSLRVRPAHAMHVSLTARVILHARKQAHITRIHEIPMSYLVQGY